MRLIHDDWQTYRAIRLAMLKDSPAAFGTTLEAAARRDEQHWRQRLTDSVVMLATVDGAPAGSVMYSDVPASDVPASDVPASDVPASEAATIDPGDCALYGMWVDPAFRAAGVGRALVDAVIRVARAAGKGRVVLHVVAGNEAAADLYRRTGFVPTGHTRPHPKDDHVVEVEMAFVLPS